MILMVNLFEKVSPKNSPTSLGQPKVNCEYVIASSDDEIYFLSANVRQSLKADQDHHSSAAMRLLISTFYLGFPNANPEMINQ